MKTTIVTAADSKFYYLLKGLILSLKAFEMSRDLPVTVLSIGLSGEEKAWLEGKGAQLVEVREERVPQRNDGRPVLSVAQRKRPFLPKLVPGYDLYLWMDADLWVQNCSAISHYLQFAARGAIAITPEVHVSYPGIYRAQSLMRAHAMFKVLFDEKTADRLAPSPTINSGMFALRGDAPHWDLWVGTLGEVLGRSDSYYAEQIALNHVIYSQNVPSVFLPAWCNWICSQTLPVLNQETGMLCEPNPPFQPLAIVHLTMTVKNGDHNIRTCDDTAVRMSLCYKRGQY